MTSFNEWINANCVLVIDPFSFSQSISHGDSKTQTYPTSLSSIAPGWKGGKLPPLGGSLGEYSLNDFDEQPAHNHRAERGVGGSRDLEEI